MKCRQKGITLIALVVTIIVLIILAGVSINMLVGENGLILMAQRAKESMQKADKEERMQLYQLEMQMQKGSTLKDILIQKGLLKDSQLQQLEEEGMTTLEDNILVVENYNGLKVLSQNCNSGNSYENMIVYLLNDIDAGATFNSETGELISGENFVPIGNSTNFNGILDGLGYAIKNIYIKEEKSSTDTGLFGIIGKEGKVQNLIVENSYIQGYRRVGAIAGQNSGSIINCVNHSKVVSDYLEAGGIAGKCIDSGNIKNCTNYGSIYNEGDQTGGIVANCDSGSSIIKNCSNYGIVNGKQDSIGGIVGILCDSYGKGVEHVISNCFNEGQVTGTSENSGYVGGIVGFVHHNITNPVIVDNNSNNGIISAQECVGGIVGLQNRAIVKNGINNGKVSASDSAVGGIVGQNKRGTILQCYNTGNIELGENGSFGVGGIAGRMGSGEYNTKIELCYNTGHITSLGNAIQAGGIVGEAARIQDENTLVEIENCYNTGEVAGLQSSGIVSWARNISISNCYNIGNASAGIVYAFADNLSLTNCYWLDSCGAEYGICSTQSNENAESKTSKELKLLTASLGEKWKNDENNKNEGYPILQWQ